MSRFEAAPDVDVKAARLIVPVVDRLIGRVRDQAAANAPDGNIWITAHDERVRPTHVKADGQLIPDNIRFILNKVRGGGTELAREPRDPALKLDNRIACRCIAVPIPGVVAASLRTTPAVLTGTRVSGSVETRFHRAAESEFAHSPDAGGHWLGSALNAVAAEVRGQARGT